MGTVRKSFKRLVPIRFNGKKDRSAKRADGRVIQHSVQSRGTKPIGEIRQRGS